MTDRLLPEMAEATRLTGLGKLMEATALIQRMLRGEPFADPTAAATPVIDAEYTVVDAGHIVPDPAPAEEQPAANKARQAWRPHASLRDAVARSAALASWITNARCRGRR